MEIRTLALGALDTNCILVHNEHGTLVIDPAAEAEKILAALREHGWPLDAVVLTHAHFDHMLALNDLPVDAVYVHEADVGSAADARRNLSAMFGRPFQCEKQVLPLQEGSEWMGFTVLHTPGHTPGSICLYNEKERILFSGDTLFRGGYGRTDFPGGSAAELSRSLNRLRKLPGDTRVLTGHGAPTTIGEESGGEGLWDL